MTLLLRALWRQLVADRLATLTSLAAIAIATGAIVAVHLLSERLVADVAASDPARLIGITHWSRGAIDEKDYFALRARWRAGELGDVTAIVPIVDGNVSAAGAAFRLVGIDPLAFAAAGPAEVHESDAAELLLDDAVLAHVTTGLLPDATISLGRAEMPVRVIGTFGSEGLPTAWLIGDIATAQRVLGVAGRLTAIGIAIRDSAPTWQRLVDGAFPGMRRSEATAVERGGIRFIPVADNELGRFSGAILFSLGVLSLLSALVAAFLVYQNTCNHVARRAPLVDRLYALGAPDVVVSGLLSMESAAIALVGAALGIVIGAAGAGALLDLVVGGAAADPTSAIGTPLGGWAIAKAVAVAFGVAGIATLLAQRQMRSRALRVGASIAGLSLLSAGGAIGASAVAGSFCAIGGICLLATVVLSGWIDFGSGAALARRGRGLFTTLNLRQARVSGRAVNAALAALLLAVATAIGMGEMVQSFRSAFVHSLDRRLANDLVVESDDTSIDPSMLALPGVTRVASYVETEALRADGSPVAVAVTDLDALEAARYGYDSDVSTDAALVSEQAARNGGLVAGDRVELVGTRDTVRLEVAHVFRDYGAARPRIVIGFDTARRFLDVPPTHRLGVRVSAASAASSVTALAARHRWRVQTREAIRADAMTTFERTFAVSDALVIVALVVAVIGMASAFASLELSRTRELRLLDVLGVSDARRLAMTVVQVGVLAIHVMLLAIPLGLAIGWILCTWLNPAGFGWSVPFGVEMRPIAIPVAFGLAASVLAAAVPLATRQATHDD